MMKPMPKQALMYPKRFARSCSSVMSEMYAVATAMFALVAPAIARPASSTQSAGDQAMNR